MVPLLKNLEHASLIKLIRVFAPNLSEEGVCEGVTSMWMQAVLTGEAEEANFYRRFDFLSTYLSNPKNTLGKLVKEIDDIYTSQKKTESSSKRKNLTAEELEKIEIRAFAESVALQQDANSANIFKEYVFQSDKSKLYPFTASKVLERGFELHLMSDFPTNEVLEEGKMYVEKVGDRLKYKLLGSKGEMIEDFLDIPIDDLTKESLHKLKEEILVETSLRSHTSKIKSAIVGTVGLKGIDLMQYFDEVKDLLKNKDMSDKPKRAGFLIGSDDHMVGVYFDAQSEKWHFFDVNHLHGRNEYYYAFDSLSLAVHLKDFFQDYNADITVFSMQYTSTLLNEKTISSLQEISNKFLPSSMGKTNARGSNTLFVAAEMGDISTINALIDAKSDLNMKDGEECTALMRAAKNGHLKVVEALLEVDLKVDVDAKQHEGWTALMLAAESGHTEIVKLLLTMDPKANVNVEAFDKWTALMAATEMRNIDTVRFLLTTDPKANIDAKSSKGWTALMLAVENNDSDMIEILLAASPKANINAVDENGITPLMLAAQYGHMQSVKALLAADPKPQLNAADNDGWTAFMFAAKEGFVDIVQTLFSAEAKGNADKKNREDVLMIAAYNNQIEVAKALFSASPKPDINAVDRKGWTALMLAVEKGHVEMVKLLLEANPKPNLAIKNNESATALKLANINRNTAIIKLLNKAKVQTMPLSKPKAFLPSAKKHPSKHSMATKPAMPHQNRPKKGR